MNKPEVRRIHTELFSDIAHDAIDSVFGNLSDGIWENSSRMEQYWRFARAERDPNGEVMIVVDKINGMFDRSGYNCKWTSNAFAEMTANQVLEFIGKKIREIMNIELKDEGLEIDKHSRHESAYLSRGNKIAAEEAYVLANILLGKRIDRKAFIPRLLIGQARTADEVAHQRELRNKLTEAELKRARKTEMAKAAYEKAVADAWNEFKDTRKALLDDGLAM